MNTFYSESRCKDLEETVDQLRTELSKKTALLSSLTASDDTDTDQGPILWNFLQGTRT